MKNYLTWFSIQLLILLTVNVVAVAQEEIPSRCWHEELDELSFLEGAWTFDSNVRLGNGVWERDTSQSIIKTDFQNCMYSETIVGKRQGHAFEARSHFTYNAIAKRYQKLWIDSEHGSMILYEGGKDEAGVWIFETEIAFGERVVKFRHQYTIENADSFSMQSQRSPDGGKSWITTWEVQYKRQQ